MAGLTDWLTPQQFQLKGWSRSWCRRDKWRQITNLGRQYWCLETNHPPHYRAASHIPLHHFTYMGTVNVADCLILTVLVSCLFPRRWNGCSINSTTVSQGMTETIIQGRNIEFACFTTSVHKGLKVICLCFSTWLGDDRSKVRNWDLWAEKTCHLLSRDKSSFEHPVDGKVYIFSGPLILALFSLSQSLWQPLLPLPTGF